MTIWLALFLAQDTRSQTDRVRSGMEASLDRQRSSVQQQARTAGATMTPWAHPNLPVTRNMPSVMWSPPPCEPVAPVELSEMIDNASEKNGVAPSVIREVARQESDFRPCAVSPAGAEGLMQLMPSTQDQFKVIDPFSPVASIDAGAKLLKQLLNKYHGDLSLALSAYNAGSGTVDRAGGIPNLPETQNYVTNILSRLGQ